MNAPIAYAVALGLLLGALASPLLLGYHAAPLATVAATLGAALACATDRRAGAA